LKRAHHCISLFEGIILMQITHQNIQEVCAGYRLIFDNLVCEVKSDTKYRGGLKCCGMSVPHLLDTYDNVELLRSWG